MITYDYSNLDCDPRMSSEEAIRIANIGGRYTDEPYIPVNERKGYEPTRCTSDPCDPDSGTTGDRDVE